MRQPISLSGFDTHNLSFQSEPSASDRSTATAGGQFILHALSFFMLSFYGGRSTKIHCHISHYQPQTISWWCSPKVPLFSWCALARDPHSLLWMSDISQSCRGFAEDLQRSSLLSKGNVALGTHGGQSGWQRGWDSPLGKVPGGTLGDSHWERGQAGIGSL